MQLFLWERTYINAVNVTLASNESNKQPGTKMKSQIMNGIFYSKLVLDKSRQSLNQIIEASSTNMKFHRLFGLQLWFKNISTKSLLKELRGKRSRWKVFFTSWKGLCEPFIKSLSDLNFFLVVEQWQLWWTLNFDDHILSIRTLLTMPD